MYVSHLQKLKYSNYGKNWCFSPLFVHDAACVGVKGELEVTAALNPFPAVLDLSTSKAEDPGNRAEQSRGGIPLHSGNWIRLVQSK